MSSLSLFAEENTAVLSPCGLYRYILTRCWDEAKPTLLWVMLNPSTADADNDDPTIRRCLGFSRAWGYGALSVVNLFAYRATDPQALESVDDPIGAENDVYIREAIASASRVIVAWGNRGGLRGRNQQVLDMIAEPFALGMTQNGEPRHPLYCSCYLTPIKYSREKQAG